LGVLATWRVTHLLAFEDGPADVIVLVRRRLGETWAGELMDCFNCLSLWVAVPFAGALARRPADRVAACLALSGAACLIERLGAGPTMTIADQPSEGADDGVLWPEANRAEAG
jgi:hypothetical protein